MSPTLFDQLLRRKREMTNAKAKAFLPTWLTLAMVAYTAAACVASIWVPERFIAFTFAPVIAWGAWFTYWGFRFTAACERFYDLQEPMLFGESSARMELARDVYGDDWDISLIECNEFHMNGECALCSPSPAPAIGGSHV